MDCDYIFVLARTNPEAPQHLGISLILVDMAQAGVEVTPVRLLSGASPFNETNFDNAIAQASDVIGGVDNGWTVGKRLLQFERSTHAGINTSGSQGGRSNDSPLPDQIKQYSPLVNGQIFDDSLRRRLLNHQIAFNAQRLTQKRVIEETAASAPGFASSAVKLSNALITQEGDEILVAAMGTQGLGWEKEGFKTSEIAATRDWLKQKSLTIAGGTKEVQLNIIAKRVLGLPD
jgi:alkylation response protein AidB-like acyl-CoA dehydrogenase